ncbi:glycosyltransferase family 4 protein [Anaeromicropila herbilytica]|uniref:Glycosyl transferase n=1 Tax=Anaeromicropila herbilytica TaxID=2785025 RepID=A0A7R7ICH9_9FIRM|nr:glycosyltransferase family 4 protein [Anaeromicropila herbilytica]BCN28973.1 glycosyl transferase [Anaeromicropila herbilytica]
MKTINMLSKADTVQGQGVLSAHDEQVNLVKQDLSNEYEIMENKIKLCDIMHYHTINFRYFLSLPFAKIKGKTVGYVHFLPETLEKSIHLPIGIKQIFYWYVIRFYKSMDYLVTVNPYFIKRLASYGISSDKVTYIPNFVSSELFYPLPVSSKSDLRKKYGLDEHKFTILCVGQLQIRKGIIDFIKIAKKLKDVQFIWAGTFAFGKISDGYDEIKKIVNNPPSNVKFVGLIKREDMNELYNLSDVMFLPSFEELFPMTILESMNCGIPILLRDIEIYEDILFDFYLRGKNIDDFISIISRLRTDQEYYHNASQLSLKGHDFYSKEHVSKMWAEFYQKVTQDQKIKRNIGKKYSIYRP